MEQVYRVYWCVYGPGRPVSRDTNMTRKSANVGELKKRQKKNKNKKKMWEK